MGAVVSGSDAELSGGEQSFGSEVQQLPIGAVMFKCWLWVE